VAQRSLPLTLALLALVACSDSEAKERLRDNARATWDSALEVAQETGTQALEAIQAQWDELEPRRRELQDRAVELQGQARETVDRLLADLEVARVRMKQRLDEVRGKGGQAVERLKAEAGAELDALHRRLDQALGRGG